MEVQVFFSQEESKLDSKKLQPQSRANDGGEVVVLEEMVAREV